MIYKNGKILPNFASDHWPPAQNQDVINTFKKYISTFSGWEDCSVWLDIKDGVFFSGAQFREGPAGKDHSFCSSASDFVEGKWGRSFAKRLTNKNDIFKNQEWHLGEQIVYGKTDFTDDVQGKSVLLLAGGPSTNDINWEKIKTDQIWSCNNYYLNDRINKKKIDLVTLATNVPLSDNPDLEDSLLKHDTKISFEIERGDFYSNLIAMNDFVAKHPDRCNFFHTRYRSAPGVALRFLCYAALLGAKDIYFAGIDGFVESGPHHSFEKNKKNPNWYLKFGPRFQDRQYVVFWDYVLSLKEKLGFNIYNLGEGHECNVLSEITEKTNPLTEDIKQLIRS